MALSRRSAFDFFDVTVLAKTPGLAARSATAAESLPAGATACVELVPAQRHLRLWGKTICPNTGTARPYFRATGRVTASPEPV